MGYKKNLKFKIYQIIFPLVERIGIHITPVHFYMPIPDTRELDDTLWQRYSEMVGINMNEENQIRLLSTISKKYKSEYERFPKGPSSIPYKYYVNNGTFSSVDGEILYSFIRYFKPKRILEIGSGNSTYLEAEAILVNEKEDKNYKCELIVIDPYPNEVVKNGFPGLSKLIMKKVQDVSLSEFKKLQEYDILFVDSSHVLKIGGDVQYIYLEILPRLNKNVLIHFHDIFLPSEYPKEWVKKNFIFWNEQYLLQAFLSFNDKYEILWAGSYMHLKHPDLLRDAFSSYDKDQRWPGSFWIKKV